jgi:uridine kinase
MTQPGIVNNPTLFAEALFTKMKQLCPALNELEMYEFNYCMENVVPDAGWDSIELEPISVIEERIHDIAFFKGIQINQKVDGTIVLDGQILKFTRMLFVGLVTGAYPSEWIDENFYFDPRGFFFLARTKYFTEKVNAHLGGKPFAAFEQKQLAFRTCPAVGYKDFKTANREVDEFFISCVQKLIAAKGTPILLAIAGQTAAGKTEIVERLSEAFRQAGRHVTSIELDNFLTDRDYREAHGIDSEGKKALHFDLLKQALADITRGKKISIPRYDFVNATSSHDMAGKLKPDGVPVEVEPADIIFMEGNFPFLLEEIVDLIGIKVVYLTDDPVRIKRKWKRDMDYRKKYSLNYFRNRYFKDQFIMAQMAYIPQLEVCDLAVDTTGAAVWASPQTAALLEGRSK